MVFWGTMKRFIFISGSFGLIAACVVSALYAYFFYIPGEVERRVIGSFNQLGFKSPSFSSLEHSTNKIIIRDVSLDDQRFGIIESVIIRYSALDFLTNNGRGNSVAIKGMKLTGELSKDNTPVMASWQNNAQLMQNLQHFPVDNISIEDAVFDLFSESLGGIRIQADGQINISAAQDMSIKAHLRSQQKRLTFSSKLEGSLEANDLLSVQADVEDFLLDLPAIQIRRGQGSLSGIFPFGDTDSHPPSLSIKGQLASLTWNNLPLRNIKVNAEVSPMQTSHYDLQGSTIGPETIEWRSNVLTTTGTDDSSLYRSNTQIMPASLGDLQSFLKRNTDLALDSPLPAILLQREAPVVTINNASNSNTKEKRGSMEIKFIDLPTVLNVEYRSDPDNELDLIGSTKVERTTFQPTVDGDDTTFFNFSALGNFTLRKYASAPELLWIAHTKVYDGLISFGSLNIPNIKGVIFLGTDSAQKKKHFLDFQFNLKSNIRQKGRLYLNLDDAASPLLGKLTLDIYDGTLEIRDPLIRQGRIARKNVLEVSNINLNTLARDARLPGVSVNGYLAGRIPFEEKDRGLYVTGGLLQSQDKGVIRLSNKITEGLFPDDTAKNERLRQALTNFHYEFFEIRIDGDLSDRVMITLSTRGKNPEIPTKDPVDVNLQIETPISVLFQSLLAQ